MKFGNMPNDGGHLLLDYAEANRALEHHGVAPRFIRPFLGSKEYIRGIERRCVWVSDEEYSIAAENAWFAARFEAVRHHRSASQRPATKRLSEKPYRFGEVRQVGTEATIIVPRVSSEAREYLPVGYLPPGVILSDSAFGLYDAPLWHLALIASRLHWVWAGTVCGRLKTDFRYSNTLGWNTFPVPTLTAKNRADLNACAENILLAREEHFPATIAELYASGKMPQTLRVAHERNDEVLERIYIGRLFQNDSERLEKLFDLYQQLTG